MKVRFEQIGRNKVTWEAELPDTEEATLVSAVRAQHALLSNDISCEGGRVYAGFHCVGRYHVLGPQTTLSA